MRDNLEETLAAVLAEPVRMTLHAHLDGIASPRRIDRLAEAIDLLVAALDATPDLPDVSDGCACGDDSPHGPHEYAAPDPVVAALDAVLTRADEGIEFGPANYLLLRRIVAEVRAEHTTKAICREQALEELEED